MAQEFEFGTHKWMLTHAVALEDIASVGTNDFGKHDSSILTDVMIMILCKAFLLPKQVEPQLLDSD
ncbi:MAG TPA: hypothetical protein VJR22_02805 [Candidatus Nitrosotalea sp.]|nr:hypothetical protein [Candidatus Nitrosotalea sp.]